MLLLLFVLTGCTADLSPEPSAPAPAPAAPAPAPAAPATGRSVVGDPQALLHATFRAAWAMDKARLKLYVANEELADRFIAAARVERARGVPVEQGVVRVELGEVGAWTAPACFPPISPKSFRHQPIGFVMEYKALHGCGAMWGTVTFAVNGDGAYTVNTLQLEDSYAVPPQK